MLSFYRQANCGSERSSRLLKVTPASEWRSLEELGGPRPCPSLPVPLHPIVQRPGGNSVAAARWGLHLMSSPLSPPSMPS